ncbi:MAG TPA: DUF899 domain-containing protein [Solirubrobacteraceae bacterium]|jgi:predicted dithiol-disulfide oxidoreductase (DUF899 family)|nr:DUF899 domain-containing protein [Solirubrobacteraceae bacterium]
MPQHTVATHEEWLAASEQLLAREKEHTRLADDLARQRRELPWVKVEPDYGFETADGTRTLAELFDGRSQLVVYHFMFGPDYDAGCPVCSSIADSFDGVIAQLNARDVTMICISRAPLEKLLAYRRRMGWGFEWASSFNSEFNHDFHHTRPREEMESWAAQAPPVMEQFASSCGTDAAGYVSERPGLSVFKLDGGDVYLTYATTSRGLEPVMTYYGILDLVPGGRDGDPPDPGWMRRHDEFEAA